jgi:Beta-1,3-glucanase
MKKLAVACMIMAFFTGTVFSQTVNMCGTVTDETGKPLTHTVLRLANTTYDNGYWATAAYMATTDQNGHYHLGTGTCIDIVVNNSLPKGEVFARPVCSGNKVLFSTPAGGSLVRMSLYDLSGRCVREVFNKSLSLGNYSVSIDTRNIASQFYVLRVTINGASSVFRLQTASHSSTGTVVQNGPGFQTRMEKLAAASIIDTLHATEPGYSLGVTPLTSLTSKCDFTLTKVTTWNGDKNAFWGDTSTYPKKGAGAKYIFLNRTNGKWPDSKVCWSSGRNGAPTPISQTNSTVFNGEVGVSIAPTDSNHRYYDFLEINGGPTGTWAGNSTRVDGWRLPIIFRVKTNDGKDTVMGDSYEMFFQSRESKFAEFINEVPKEFTWEARHDFANIYAPHKADPFPFRSTGPYGDYYKRYQDSVVKNYVKDPLWVNVPNAYGGPNTDPGAYPEATQADDIFACTGPNPSIGASPQFSAAMNRHVAHMEPHGIGWHRWAYEDSASFYLDAPANFYSRWCHRRCINNYDYGFPYDDNGDHQSYMTMSNIQWFAVAIGW